MAREITLTVGDSFAERHEQLLEQLGEEYEAVIREHVEDDLHQLTKQLERNAEQQLQLQQEMVNNQRVGMDAEVNERVEKSN